MPDQYGRLIWVTTLAREGLCLRISISSFSVSMVLMATVGMGLILRPRCRRSRLPYFLTGFSPWPLHDADLSSNDVAIVTSSQGDYATLSGAMLMGNDSQQAFIVDAGTTIVLREVLRLPNGHSVIQAADTDGNPIGRFAILPRTNPPLHRGSRATRPSTRCPAVLAFTSSRSARS